MKCVVEFLSSDSLKGRSIGEKGIDESADFIIKEYKSLGLKFFDSTKKSFLQTFTLPDSIEKYGGIKCNNIVGLIDNKADSSIVIAAHYDHLGNCSPLSKEVIQLKKCEIHNGADDNASGVSMVLALAKHLTKQKNKKYNYVFVMFSAHEIGLYGSGFFYESIFFRDLKIKALLNFDMVGRLNKSSKSLKTGGFENRKDLQKILTTTKACQSKGLNLLYNDEQLLMSDATIFYKNKVSAFTFTTGITEDYHRSTDESNKINYEGMKTICGFIIEILAYITK